MAQVKRKLPESNWLVTHGYQKMPLLYDGWARSVVRG